MDTETDTGAEAGNEGYLATVEAEQTAAETADGLTPETEGSALPEADEAAAEAPGEGQPEALPPLTNEEYQKRHVQTVAALRETRQAEKATRQELAALKATVEHLQTSQPAAFEKFQIDQRLANAQTIDWGAWLAQDYATAQQEINELQAAHARHTEITQAEQQRQQLAQQQAEQQHITTLVTTLQEQEAEFRADKPDYGDAASFLRGQWLGEANANGYFGDQAELYVNNVMLQLGNRLSAAGQNMAEHGYNLAIQKGYKPPVATIAPMKAGEAAAKTISNLGPKSDNSGGTFEEKMGSLNGAAARDFWAKARKDANA